jgi:hypothetical protein
MFEGDESTLISAFEVGVPFCSALGFLVGSSVSMMPEILAMIVAESARAGGFGPRAVRRGFLRRVDPMGIAVSFWVSGFSPSAAADGSWIERFTVTTVPRPAEERLAALMPRWQRPYR